MEFLNEDDECSEAEAKLLAKLEKYFQSEGLSKFSSRAGVAYFQKFAGRMPNVTRYVLNNLNNKPSRAIHPGQKGCPSIIPGLRSFPVWLHADKVDASETTPETESGGPMPLPSDFPWITQVESYFERIREEFRLQQGRQSQGGIKFQPYRGPPAEDNDNGGQLAGNGSTNSDQFGKFATNDSGNWNVCYMSLHNEKISAEISSANLDNMEVTASLLSEAIPRDYHHCLFSAVSSGTHILPHHGPTNKKLRIHLPIIVPSINGNDELLQSQETDDGVGWKKLSPDELLEYDITKETRPCLRAHDEIIYFREGQCFVFDDSFEHEVFNPTAPQDSSMPIPPRVVLIIDIWHPDLTIEEVKYLKFMEKNQMRSLSKLDNVINESTTSDTDTDTSTSSINPTGSSTDTSNFYSVILNARYNSTVNDDHIWGVK